jgi:hypothetical protein
MTTLQGLDPYISLILLPHAISPIEKGDFRQSVIPAKAGIQRPRLRKRGFPQVFFALLAPVDL